MPHTTTTGERVIAFKVTDHIPQPGKATHTKHQVTVVYPLEKMKVGDSFFVARKDAPVKFFHSHIYRIAKELGLKVAVRRRRERPGGIGYRVWLIGKETTS